jgi:transposase
VGQRRRENRCRVLLVDETSLRRRHRYVTVLSDGESGAVLGMVRHRDFKALSGFFVSQGHRWCRRVSVVVSDGSESYKAAIDRHLGHATHVLDRFHVARWFAQGLVEVRRRIQRRQPPGVTPAFDPQVFRSRYLALKRADRLSDAEHERLKAIFAVHAELARGWGAAPTALRALPGRV